jgi:hypothetical protein
MPRTYQKKKRQHKAEESEESGSSSSSSSSSSCSSSSCSSSSEVVDVPKEMTTSAPVEMEVTSDGDESESSVSESESESEEEDELTMEIGANAVKAMAGRTEALREANPAPPSALDRPLLQLDRRTRLLRLQQRRPHDQYVDFRLLCVLCVCVCVCVCVFHAASVRSHDAEVLLFCGCFIVCVPS